MEYPKVCENCGKKYKAKHRRGKFCSDYCRVDSNRKQNKASGKKTPAKKKAPVKKKAAVKKTVGKLVKNKKGKVSFRADKKGNIAVHAAPKKSKFKKGLAKAEFVIGFDPVSGNTEIKSGKVTKKSNGESVAEYHGRPEDKENEVMDQAAKAIKAYSGPKNKSPKLYEEGTYGGHSMQGGAEVVEKKNSVSKNFNEWVTMAKNGEITKEQIASSPFNANQKSMLNAKLKQ